MCSAQFFPGLHDEGPVALEGMTNEEIEEIDHLQARERAEQREEIGYLEARERAARGASASSEYYTPLAHYYFSWHWLCKDCGFPYDCRDMIVCARETEMYGRCRYQRGESDCVASVAQMLMEMADQVFTDIPPCKICTAYVCMNV